MDEKSVVQMVPKSLNLFKKGGKIQASQVQTKIKSFVLGERVDANQFSNEINFNSFFLYLQSD